jgi:hypothetical protein
MRAAVAFFCSLACRTRFPCVPAAGRLASGCGVSSACQHQAFIGGEFIEASPPRALTLEGISAIVGAFRRGAENAIAAGFDGVELHAANGYLLDQFLRDGANRRDDAYGGSIVNRARLATSRIATRPRFSSTSSGASTYWLWSTSMWSKGLPATIESGCRPLAQSHDVKSSNLGVQQVRFKPMLLAQNQTGADTPVAATESEMLGLRSFCQPRAARPASIFRKVSASLSIGRRGSTLNINKDGVRSTFGLQALACLTRPRRCRGQVRL